MVIETPVPPDYAQKKLKDLDLKIEPGFFKRGGFSEIYRVSAIKKKPGDDEQQTFVFKFTEAQKLITLAEQSADGQTTPEQVKKLLDTIAKEATEMLTLQHPYVVEYVNSFMIEDKDKKYPWKASGLFLKECRSGTMEDVLNKAIVLQSPVSENKIRRYFLQIALGLEYIHLRGILHLDIKLANVFVDNRDGVELIKIGDFGLCRNAHSWFVDTLFNSSPKALGGGRKSSFLLTQLGDPAYFSPERNRQREKWKPTEKDDVYAYGVMLNCFAANISPDPSSDYESDDSDQENDNGNLFRPQLLDTPRYGRSSSLANLAKQVLERKSKNRATMTVVVDCEFFQKDDIQLCHLSDVIFPCNDNLYHRLKLKCHAGIPFGETRLDKTLQQWALKVARTRVALDEEFVNWQAAVEHILLEYRKIESEAIKHAHITKGTQIGGGAVGIAGAVTSGVGILLTATGVGAVAGVPLIATGIGLGVAGSAATIGASIAEAILEHTNVNDVKAVEERLKASDERLSNIMKELVLLLPQDEVYFQDKDSKPVGDVDMSGVILRVTQTVFKGVDVAGEIIEALAKTSFLTASRVAAAVLLPIGVLLDVGTIVRAGVTLKDSAAADLVNHLCRILEAKKMIASKMLEKAKDIEYKEKRISLFD